MISEFLAQGIELQRNYVYGFIFNFTAIRSQVTLQFGIRFCE